MDTKQLWKRMGQDDNYPCGQYWQKYSDDAERIIEVYLSLPEEHKASYDVMFTQAANLPFFIQTCNRWHGSLATGAMLRAACGPLLTKGLLASVRMAWGDRKLFIPDDIYNRLLVYHLNRDNLAYTQIYGERNQVNLIEPNFFPHYKGNDSKNCLKNFEAPAFIGEGSAVTSRNEKQNARFPNVPKGLKMHLFHLLVHALHKGLPLTAKGLLHKRVVSQLDSMLQLDKEALSHLHVKSSFRQSLPPHVILVLDMALRLGLLRQHMGCYVVQLEQLNGFLNLPGNEVLHAMIATAVEHYLPRKALIRHFVHTSLYLGGKNNGSSDEAIINQFLYLGWLREDIDTINDARARIQAWLYVAHALGWYEVRTEERRWVFRTADHDTIRADKCLFVQPDFEIIVPPHTPLSIRFELEMFSQLQNCDRVDIYRLTRKSFEDGLENGRSIQFVMSLLMNYSLTGVPNNVRDTLEMWERCWEGKEQSRIPILWQQHNKRGKYPGKMQAELVYSPSSLQYDEIDTSSLENDVEASGKDDISSQWTKALRSYHASTKRDIVTAAIRYQTQLEVEFGGQTRIVVPLSSSISNEREWKVLAYVLPCPPHSNPTQLCPEQWDRVRIIMPKNLL